MNSNAVAIEIHGESKLSSEFMEADCCWTGKLLELEAHVAQCDFTPVPCPNATNGCDKLFRKYLLPNHEISCSFRVILCRICDISMPFHELSQHEATVCSGAVTKCPKGCGKQIIRKDLSDHVQSDCELAQIDCLFRPHGCLAAVVRRDADQHQLSAAHIHNQLVSDTVLKLKREVETKNKVVIKGTS